jgi:hypothetical protein
MDSWMNCKNQFAAMTLPKYDVLYLYMVSIYSFFTNRLLDLE